MTESTQLGDILHATVEILGKTTLTGMHQFFKLTTSEVDLLLRNRQIH
jgi:hypothetical protein